MLRLPIIEYEALTELTDSSKKKEVLECLPLFFVFSDNSFAVKGLPIDKTKKIFCVVCERSVGNLNGIKLHLASTLHKSNSSSVFQEENKTCKLI